MPRTRTLRRIGKAVTTRSVRLRWRVRQSLRHSDEAEVFILPLLSRGGAFLDIGANIGSWTGPAARAFRTVHAFEPNPELAAALRAVAPKNVTVHQVALSDREGSARFMVPLLDGEPLTTRASLELGANPGYEEVSFDVELVRLDALDLRGVDVMKIDVEGHEEATLAGAGETIARERPSLIVEIEERHHPGRSEQIIASIVARGYSCYYLRGDTIEIFEPGSIDVLQPSALIPESPGKDPGYVNNFFFSPAERRHEMEAAHRLRAERGA